MIPNISGFELLLLLAIAFLVFGPKKLPEMTAAIGKSIQTFKKGLNGPSSVREEKELSRCPVEEKERRTADQPGGVNQNDQFMHTFDDNGSV
jgi:sec-independent protein translocase protein TatA